MQDGTVYPWTRFWCPSEASYSLADDGYLVDPEGVAAKYFQRFVCSLEAISGKPCLGLLGEAGSGKSIELRAERRRLQAKEGPDRVMYLDLKAYGSDLGLSHAIFESEKFLAWRRGGDILYLLLDSLDECRLQFPYVASFLVDRFGDLAEHLSRLRLRIACRTPEWPRQFSSAFPALWGSDGFGRYELVPLRKRDVRSACAFHDIGADDFLAAVARVDAQPLANRPITLRLLLNIFQGRELPGTRAAVFSQGCRLLADDPSLSRQDAGQAGKLSPDEKLAVAARIAALLMFCRRRAVEVEVPSQVIASGELTMPEIGGGTEPVGNGRVAVDRQAIGEVLFRTSLFSDRAFIHQSFAEFLAAKYLVENHHLSPDTLLSLLVDGRIGRGRVIPQLSELAGWVAELHPEVRRRLVNSDPQALLRSDLGAVSPAEKEELTRSLLQGFAAGELGEIGWTLQSDHYKLRHPGLAAQLEPYIRDRTKDPFVRRLAIDIARSCDVRELLDVLATLALDTTESPGIRDDAARTVAKIADTEDLRTKRRLLPLATGIGDDDPEDQLKGHALTALWPGGIAVGELLSYLTDPKSEHMLGSYWAFLKFTAAQRMPAEDLPVALEWAGKRPAGQRPGLGDFIDELLLVAARHLAEPLIRAALAHALLSSMLSRLEVFSDADKRREFVPTIQQSPARKSLAQDLVEGISDRGRQGSNLAWLGVLGPADLDWMIERHSESDPSVAEHWAHLIRALFVQEDPRQVDAILSAAQTSKILADVFRDLLRPVEWQSEEAAELKKYYGYLTKPARSRRPRARPQMADLTSSLERIESGGVLEAFATLAHHLTNYESSRDALETNIAGGAVWREAPGELRGRILAAAKRALVEGGAADRAWLGANRIAWQAMAVYRALLLLTTEEPQWLAMRGGEFWRKWAALVIRFPIDSGRSEEDPDLPLVCLAYSGAADETIAMLLERIDEENEDGHLFVLDKFRRCWDRGERLCRAVLARVQRGGLKREPLRQLLAELVQRECPDAARYAKSLIPSPLPAEPEARRLAATVGVSLLTGPQPDGWETVWRAIREDVAFGSEVLGMLAHFSHEKGVARLAKALPEETVAELFLWMIREFPPAEDPKFDGVVTERRAVADLRDRLLRLLKEKGSLAARDALRRLEETLGPRYPGLRTLRVEAERRVLEESWLPLSPSDLLKLATAPAVRVVQSGDQLLEAVLISLGRLQEKLQGAPPAVDHLWDQIADDVYRPKDEHALANEIVRHLREDLQPDGFVALREVEVEPGIGSGPGRRTGSRTDILVTGVVGCSQPGQTEKLEVVLEVKGSWHPGLKDYLRTQLVDRYLERTHSRHGVYVVGWYQCSLWDAADPRSRQSRTKKLETLKEELDDAARDLSVGRTVRAVVLDVRLSPT
ncbi:MAG TPA: hypothetical protein VHR45_19050 [Thermoanaerobaculia bacterium]|nr:hypothetical protein [Thermoanaerobaculia bacterium]